MSSKQETRKSSRKESSGGKKADRKERHKKEKSPKKSESKKRSRDSDVESARPTKKAKDLKHDSSPFLTNDQKLIEEFRTENNISVHGDVTNWKPLSSFVETGLPQEILACTSGFSKPTAIQAQTWPIALSKRDVIGIAETGSGKTFAFGLPALAHVKNSPKSNNPTVLVLAPTRELAQQSHDVLQKAAAGCTPKIRTTVVFGGIPKGKQIYALKSGIDILFACPGRVLDLCGDGVCDLSNVSYMVLDEADRMLDMGFEKDIRRIFGMIQKQRQTLMFSATWPLTIQALASEFLDNPIRTVVGSESLKANAKVEQIVEVLEMNQRYNRLIELIGQYHQKKEKIIVFVLYKKEASNVERILTKNRIACISIHGDKSTTQRAEALASFKAGSPPILIATDVAARGLDIPKVEYVINFQFPLTTEDYVHRIGRTGRAGATGISHTFFGTFDKHLSGELIGVLRAAKATVPPELLAFGVAVKKKEPKLGKINLNAAASNHVTFSDSEDDQ